MKYYTGIGSRETPKDILALMEKIAYKLADAGYVLRSGAARGADTAFENGVKKYSQEVDYFPSACIYIPWSGFTDIDPYYKDWYKVLDRMPSKLQAYQLASETHPAWERCSKGAKALHARNTFQILGPNLNDPSSFLICWANVDKHGNIRGGTATAWNLAKKYNVPCFNLCLEQDRKRLEEFLEEK